MIPVMIEKNNAILSLEITIFDIKMMVKSDLVFCFEIQRAPSEIPTNLQGQGRLFCSGQQHP